MAEFVMRSDRELEAAVSDILGHDERHNVEMAMIHAKMAALRRLRAEEAHQRRREMVMASPAARRRLAEIEAEELSLVRKPVRRETRSRAIPITGAAGGR